jgi:hypothetical protein
VLDDKPDTDQLVLDVQCAVTGYIAAARR